MTATALPPLRPITDIQVAVDALLDARWNVLAVKESALGSRPELDKQCDAILLNIDGAIVGFRKEQK